MLWRRRIDWLAVDWYAFLAAGGVLTVDAWERATPASRGALLVARQAIAAPTAPQEQAAPEPAAEAAPWQQDGTRTVADELRSLGASRR